MTVIPMMRTLRQRILSTMVRLTPANKNSSGLLLTVLAVTTLVIVIIGGSAINIR